MFALGRLLFLVSYTEQALMASQEHRYRILMIIEGKYLYHLEIYVFLLFPNIIVTTKTFVVFKSNLFALPSRLPLQCPLQSDNRAVVIIAISSHNS